MQVAFARDDSIIHLPKLPRLHAKRIDVQVRDVDIPHLLDRDIATRHWDAGLRRRGRRGE